MKITITDLASKWFHDDMGVTTGNGVRFYGKTYGKTAVHSGFSIGIMRDDEPHQPIAWLKRMVSITMSTTVMNGSLRAMISQLIMMNKMTARSMTTRPITSSSGECLPIAINIWTKNQRYLN